MKYLLGIEDTPMDMPRLEPLLSVVPDAALDSPLEKPKSTIVPRVNRVLFWKFIEFVSLELPPPSAVLLL